MYPGLGLLLGVALDRLATDWPKGRGWLLWPLALAAGLLAAAAAWIPGLAVKEAEVLAVFEPWLPAAVIALLLTLSAGALLALALAWRGRPTAAPVALAAVTGTAVLASVLFIMPQFDRVKSARPLSRILLEQMLPGEVYGIYPAIEPAFLFYTERFCELPASEADLHAFEARPERVWLLAKRQALEELEIPLGMREVARDQDLKGGYLLLSNR